MLEINTAKQNDIIILELEGILDSQSSKDFKSWVNEKISMGYRAFAFDSLGLKYLSSGGISIILEIAQLLQHKKGAMSFFNIRPEVQKLFTLLKIEKSIPIHATKEIALEHLSIFAKEDIQIEKQKSIFIEEDNIDIEKEFENKEKNKIDNTEKTVEENTLIESKKKIEDNTIINDNNNKNKKPQDENIKKNENNIENTKNSIKLESKINKVDFEEEILINESWNDDIAFTSPKKELKIIESENNNEKVIDEKEPIKDTLENNNDEVKVITEEENRVKIEKTGKKTKEEIEDDFDLTDHDIEFLTSDSNNIEEEKNKADVIIIEKKTETDLSEKSDSDIKEKNINTEKKSTEISSSKKTESSNNDKIIYCQNCGSKLRVKISGTYVCPTCRNSFFYNQTSSK